MTSSIIHNGTSEDENHLNYDRLNQVVSSISSQLSNPALRKINNRAVQAKIWSDPIVSSCMTDLRHREESIRNDLMSKMSVLMNSLHQYCIDATLARANILKDERINARSSLTIHERRKEKKQDSNDNECSMSISDDAENCTAQSNVDIFCLDAKERLYLILKEYQWMNDFYRLHPMHFFENSFQFVNSIPANKNVDIKVKVVGLGVGGSLAVSGLKKRGIQYVVGYDKRARYGERSVTSRYQNASWRAYEIAQKLLDHDAYNHMVSKQQKIHVRNNDGTSRVLNSTDRVQIILGNAIDSALASAERYGAKLQFNCNVDEFYQEDLSTTTIGVHDNNDEEKVDIVALFTGAHTSKMFDGLGEQMNIHKWPELSSKCRMWLQIKPSERRASFTARDVEVGAENFHFAVESARNTIHDIKRIRYSIITQYANAKKKRQGIADNKNKDNGNSGGDADADSGAVIDEQYQNKLQKIDELIETIENAQKKDTKSRFDYIFATAPDNDHNQSKIERARNNGNVVIEGNYQVDVQIASKAVIDVDTCCSSSSSDQGKRKLCDQFSTNVIVVGGDACVPPNPMAAYGATLACKFAEMLVELAVSRGHLNSIENGLMRLCKNGDVVDEDIKNQWVEQVKELKILFTKYHDAKGRSENYFQWMQTLICNLYSLPPQS